MLAHLLFLIDPYRLLRNFSNNYLIFDYSGVPDNDRILTPRRYFQLRSSTRERLNACLKHLGILKTGDHDSDDTA